MPPDSPQPNMGGGQPQQGQSLDPSIVALTKSIGKAESGGNYNAGDNTGDGASSFGAYQFTPGFLSEWAPKAGIQYQPGMKLNPSQQDEIAYKAVQTMGTEGDPAYPQLGKLSPAQITSAWNTGNPDAYLDPTYGKNNTYGSTENYVNKVSEYYKEAMGNQSNPQSSSIVPTANAASSPSGDTQSSGQPDWMTALEGLGLGAAGWIAGKAKAPLIDAGTDAAAGAAVGSIIPGEGTLAGGITGGVAGLVQGVIQDVAGGDNSQTPTSTSSDQPATQPAQPQMSQAIPESATASGLVKNAINETMQGTQSNRTFSESKPGKDAINIAAQHGLVAPDENGNLTFNSEKLQKLEGAIERGKDGVIGSQEGATASPDSVAKYAGSFIGKDKTNTAADRQKAAKIVQSELGADSGGVGMNGQMSLADMRAAQKTHYKAAQASYTNPKPSSEMLAHKALGNAYGRAIRDKISKEDQPLYDKLTKTSRDLTNAKQLKKKIEGKKVPKEKMGAFKTFAVRALQAGAKAAEIYIGDALGGPIGAIIGSMIGEHFNGKLSKAFNKNVFETKGMKAALGVLHNTKPKEYTQLIDALKKRGVEIPKDDIAKPDTEEGLVKLTKKEEKEFSPKATKSK